MSLPTDFHDFIEPQDLREQPDWADLLPDGAGNAPYEARFYVMGFRKAAAGQGFYGANALWDALSEVGKKKADQSAQNKKRIEDAVQQIIANVPSAWKKQIPDPHDHGNAKPHNTYWREYGLPQLLRSWKRQHQTLPKALLAISALHLAVKKKGVRWADVMKATPITIRPSVYWIVDYTPELHASAIVPQTRASYEACGLSFDVGVKQKSTALEDAANGRSLTFATAKALRDLLHSNGHTQCGDLRIIASKMRRQPAALEVFRGV